MTSENAIARASAPAVVVRLSLAMMITAAFFFALQPVTPKPRLSVNVITSSFAGLFSHVGVVPAAAPSTLERELSMSPAELLDRWSPLIVEASRRFGIPQSWIRAVVRQESGGRTLSDDGQPITSKAGAMGIMQVMPETYREMRADYRLGADPYDPHDNIIAGTAYLSWLHRKYGFPNMFAAYNDGPGNFDKHLSNDKALPAETVAYLANVTAHLKTADSRHRRFSRTLRLAQE